MILLKIMMLLLLSQRSRACYNLTSWKYFTELSSYVRLFTNYVQIFLTIISHPNSTSYKTVPVLLSLYPFRAPYRIILLYLVRLPRHVHRVVIEQQKWQLKMLSCSYFLNAFHYSISQDFQAIYKIAIVKYVLNIKSYCLIIGQQLYAR